MTQTLFPRCGSWRGACFPATVGHGTESVSAHLDLGADLFPNVSNDVESVSLLRAKAWNLFLHSGSWRGSVSPV